MHFRGVGIFDLLSNDECLFGVLNGLSALAELVQRQTHIPQRIAFASAVANLACDSEVLFTSEALPPIATARSPVTSTPVFSAVRTASRSASLALPSIRRCIAAMSSFGPDVISVSV